MKRLIGNITATLPVAALFILMQAPGCASGPTKKRVSKQQASRAVPRVIEVVQAPKAEMLFKPGDSIPVSLNFRSGFQVDSTHFYLPGGTHHAIRGSSGSTTLPPVFQRIGLNSFRAEVFFNDSLTESRTLQLTLLSDIIPRRYSYRVVNRYPHDDQAYTQGLLYHNGYLYESTGQLGHSSMRKVEITSGNPVKKVDLNAQMFGEGIALFENNLFQITWRNRIGYVYDINTLELIRSFNYPMAEGWGLTNDEEKLYMTDGSAQIYLLDPVYFTHTGQIEVMNHKGRVSQLNELEYIEGKLFANIYGQTLVIIIDPLTGKVEGEIEFKELMPAGFQGDMDRVLNGIAFNPATNHLYITGKLWPFLYEIRLEGFFD